VDPTLPTFDDLLTVAPIATITLLIAGIGFYAAMKSSQRTIDALKEILEHFKSRGDK